MSIDRNTIFDNAPDPKPLGPWMSQDEVLKQTSNIDWNPDQEIGDPEMGHTSEIASWEGNPAAAFQISHATR